MIDKAESRRIRIEMRRVFLNTRDPIGIQNEPNSQDEYDRYIARVSALLVGGAPDSEVIDYLFWAVHEHMGLKRTREDMLPTLAELTRIGISHADGAAGLQQ